MKPMKQFPTTIIAILALASSAFGAIGETPKQFESSKPVEVKKYQQGTAWMTWAGPKVVHRGLFDPESEGQRCVMESFWFRDGHAMSKTEMGKFLEPYLPYMSSFETQMDATNTYTFWKADDGTVFIVAIYELNTHLLTVMTVPVWEQIYEKQALASIAAYKQQSAGSAQSQAPSDPGSSTDQQDCLIVATEAFARLSKSAYWAKIAGFMINNNGKQMYGHAVVFFQPTEGSNVWMYDKSGSYDLSTRSHDLIELTRALNQSLKSSYAVSDSEWVDKRN
jgi:hypothetical protein